MAVRCQLARGDAKGCGSKMPAVRSESESGRLRSSIIIFFKVISHRRCEEPIRMWIRSSRVCACVCVRPIIWHIQHSQDVTQLHHNSRVDRESGSRKSVGNGHQGHVEIGGDTKASLGCARLGFVVACAHPWVPRVSRSWPHYTARTAPLSPRQGYLSKGGCQRPRIALISLRSTLLSPLSAEFRLRKACWRSNRLLRRLRG